MFTRHSIDFADITSVTHAPGAMLSLSAETMIETQSGWTRAADLTPTDHLASLDGGFVPVAWLRRALPCAAILVPAGALGNCSDLILPEDTHIGVDAPLNFEVETDMLSLPLRAFLGQNGIRLTAASEFITLGLASEEMLWAQTGLLIHARPMSNGYFHTLCTAQARALITGPAAPISIAA